MEDPGSSSQAIIALTRGDGAGLRPCSLETPLESPSPLFACGRERVGAVDSHKRLCWGMWSIQGGGFVEQVAVESSSGLRWMNVINPADDAVVRLAVDFSRKLRWVNVIEPAGGFVGWVAVGSSRQLRQMERNFSRR